MTGRLKVKQKAGLISFLTKKEAWVYHSHDVSKAGLFAAWLLAVGEGDQAAVFAPFTGLRL